MLQQSELVKSSGCCPKFPVLFQNKMPSLCQLPSTTAEQRNTVKGSIWINFPQWTICLEDIHLYYLTQCAEASFLVLAELKNTFLHRVDHRSSVGFSPVSQWKDHSVDSLERRNDICEYCVIVDLRLYQRAKIGEKKLKGAFVSCHEQKLQYQAIN